MISDDEPIHATAEDLLGRWPVAERIVDVVRSRPTSAPLVLALHGPWGSGKSSVLSLVREALAESDIICVEFQPWLFNNVEQLIRPFFATVYEALVKAGAPAKKLRKALEKFGGLLTTATKVAGYELDFATLTERTPSDLRDEIKKVSESLRKRIVVVIDDVDRLPLEELALLLKLVRLCGNLPYFTYVLAYDRRVVSSALRGVYQGDSDFLDKIVQVEVPLPPVPPRLLADYVCSGLTQLGRSLGVDMAKVVEEFAERDDETRVLLAPLGENDDPRQLVRSLRDAKRFLNGLATTLPLVRHEVDLVDFALIELIRIFLPALYDDVYARRVSLTAYDNRLRNDALRQKRQAEHQRLAADIRAVAHGEVALRILCTLFPVFNASIYTPNQHYGPNSRWQMHMKASDPAHVEKYFQLRVPLDSVPRKLVRDALDAVNSAATPAHASAAFSAATKEHYEKKRLGSFTEGVVLEIARVNAARLATLIEGLAQLAPAMAAKPRQERELSTVVIAALRIAKVMPAAESKKLMVELVSTCNESFAIGLLSYAKPNEYQPSGVGVDYDAMRAVFLERLKAQIVGPTEDLFAKYEYEWGDVLKVWAAPSDAGHYLAALLTKKPERWATLAEAALSQRIDQLSLNLPPLRALVDLGELDLASRTVDVARFDREACALVTAFLCEVQLVPDLLVELGEVRECAVYLSGLQQGTLPSDADWSTPTWARARPRLEPIHSGGTWWPALVRVFETFARSEQDANAVGAMSSPEAAVDASAATEALHALAGQLIQEVDEVIGQLREVVGLQTPLTIELPGQAVSVKIVAA